MIDRGRRSLSSACAARTLFNGQEPYVDGRPAWRTASRNAGQVYAGWAMAAEEPQPTPRTCPNCGREARTRFERCPHCQTSYYALTHSQRRRRWIFGAATAAVVVAGATVAVVLALADHSHQQARRKVTETREIAALRARTKRVQAPHRGAARNLKPAAGATDAQRLAARKALVGAVERQITRDARARVKAGELDGPIASSSCGPILKSKTAIPDDRVLSKHIGRYDCVAIKHHVINGEHQKVAELGFAFVAALNFDTYTYTWCRNTPAQGEAGVALVFVRLDRACLAATGKVMGTGYVVGADPNH